MEFIQHYLNLYNDFHDLPFAYTMVSAYALYLAFELIPNVGTLGIFWAFPAFRSTHPTTREQSMAELTTPVEMFSVISLIGRTNKYIF